VRLGGAFVNLLLAGVFVLFAVQWFSEGATGWAAFAAFAVLMNLVLAVWKIREARALPPVDGTDGEKNQEAR